MHTFILAPCAHLWLPAFCIERAKHLHLPHRAFSFLRALSLLLSISISLSLTRFPFLSTDRSLACPLFLSLSPSLPFSVSLSPPHAPPPSLACAQWWVSALSADACEIHDVNFYWQRSGFKFATLRMACVHVLSRSLTLVHSLPPSFSLPLSLSPSPAIPLWVSTLMSETYDVRTFFDGQRLFLEFATLRYDFALSFCFGLFSSLFHPLSRSPLLSLACSLASSLHLSLTRFLAIALFLFLALFFLLTPSLFLCMSHSLDIDI